MMPTDKIFHFVGLIIIIIFFSWLNSSRVMEDKKEGFHPKVKQHYRSGMRNLNNIRDGMSNMKEELFNGISKRLGY